MLVWVTVMAGQEIHLHALPGDRIGAGDQSLAGDHGGSGREQNHGQPKLGRRHEKERVCDRRRVGEDQRSLAEVI